LHHPIAFLGANSTLSVAPFSTATFLTQTATALAARHRAQAHAIAPAYSIPSNIFRFVYLAATVVDTRVVPALAPAVVPVRIASIHLAAGIARLGQPVWLRIAVPVLRRVRLLPVVAATAITTVTPIAIATATATAVNITIIVSAGVTDTVVTVTA
jgi:hypothetical protein